MWYVYTLYSKKDRKLYIGCTNDLKTRIIQHNAGKVLATRFRRPFILIHYETYLDKQDAYLREGWLKTGWGRNHLQKILKHTLEKYENH